MDRVCRRGVLIASLALVLGLLAPISALAVGAPVLRIDRVHWDRRLVEVEVTCPADAVRVVVYDNGVEVTSTAPPASGSLIVKLAPSGIRRLRAEVADAQGGSAASSVLTVDPASFRPRTASVGLPANRLVGARLSGRGVADRWRTTKVAVQLGGKTKWTGTRAIGTDGKFALPGISLGTGTRPKVRIGVSNVWGTRWSSTVTLYNLGSKTPSASSFLLVDKSTCYLYDVRSRVVRRTYPVAVGMPGTPTPEGYFKLGAARAAGGAWGVLRRRLSRFSGSRLYPTSYYIHGTNAPDSIGTWASHGCVRMYNSDIRRVTRTVPTGTLVFIRK